MLDSESTVSEGVVRAESGGERLAVYVDTIVDVDHRDGFPTVRTNAAALAFLTATAE